MTGLKVQRCFNHAGREAVARCTICGRFYCRECVAEHEGKMTCGRCLSAAGLKADNKRFMDRVVPAALMLSGFMVLWLLFFMAGQGLLAIPSSFHEGTVWKKGGKSR